VVSVRVFRYLTGRGDIGAAAALSLVLALLLVVFLFLYFRFFVGRVEEADAI
jgi:multiple sugar transport system permease protein